MFDDINPHNGLFDAAIRRSEREEELAQENAVVHRLEDRLKTKESDKKDGWKVLAKMEWVLHKMMNIESDTGKGKKFGLSEQQKDFWREFVIAILPVIFDKVSLAENLDTLSRSYQFEYIPKICLILAPRKIGKTYFSTMFLTILAYSMPEAEIPLFATALRTSDSALKHCVKFLQVISGIVGENLKKSKGSSRTLVMKNAWGGKSIINSYPAVSDSVRGVTGNIAFVDEIGFVKRQFIEEVVIPLMTRCPILAITTRNKEISNYVNTLIENNDEDDPYLRLVAKMMACDACVELNRADECEHMVSVLPEWQSPQAIRHIQRILSGNKSTFMRETLGIDGNESEKCFDKDKVLSLKNFQRIEFIKIPAYLLISLDPAAGGFGSRIVIFTTFIQGDVYVVRQCSKKNFLFIFRTNIFEFVIELNQLLDVYLS